MKIENFSITSLKNYFNSKETDKAQKPFPLSKHFLFNAFFFTTSFIIFYRNHHYFKFNNDLLSKYWGFFLITNTFVFFSSGFLTIGWNFLNRYRRVINKYLSLSEE